MNTKSTKHRLRKAGLAAIGAAALAVPAPASADVSVTVGSADVSVPLLNCEPAQLSSSPPPNVIVPDISVPVSVGPVIPPLGRVTIGDDQVPVGGTTVEVTVDGELPGERVVTTPVQIGVTGPDPIPVDQSVTLPLSAELIGARTPDRVAVSSCKAEAAPAPPAETPKEPEHPSEQPGETPEQPEQPSEAPEQPSEAPEQPEQPREPEQPQQQPEQPKQPEQQPEQPQANQSNAQAESPAPQTEQPAANPQHQPATTGQDKATKSKETKAKKAKKSKKSKKGKAKRRNGKGRRR